MAQSFLETFQWYGVKRGDGFAFYAGDIKVEEPVPLERRDPLIAPRRESR
jgi:hypothetical protein